VQSRTRLGQKKAVPTSQRLPLTEQVWNADSKRRSNKVLPFPCRCGAAAFPVRDGCLVDLALCGELALAQARFAAKPGDVSVNRAQLLLGHVRLGDIFSTKSQP
jgi:hypothetical protein